MEPLAAALVIFLASAAASSIGLADGALYAILLAALGLPFSQALGAGALAALLSAAAATGVLVRRGSLLSGVPPLRAVAAAGLTLIALNSGAHLLGLILLGEGTPIVGRALWAAGAGVAPESPLGVGVELAAGAACAWALARWRLLEGEEMTDLAWIMAGLMLTLPVGIRLAQTLDERTLATAGAALLAGAGLMLLAPGRRWAAHAQVDERIDGGAGTAESALEGGGRLLGPGAPEMGGRMAGVAGASLRRGMTGAASGLGQGGAAGGAGAGGLGAGGLEGGAGTLGQSMREFLRLDGLWTAGAPAGSLRAGAEGAEAGAARALGRGAGVSLTASGEEISGGGFARAAAGAGVGTTDGTGALDPGAGSGGGGMSSGGFVLAPALMLSGFSPRRAAGLALACAALASVATLAGRGAGSLPPFEVLGAWGAAAAGGGLAGGWLLSRRRMPDGLIRGAHGLLLLALASRLALDALALAG